MSRQAKWTIRVLAVVYAVAVVAGCIALTFDRTGAVNAAMEFKLFPIPFFVKDINVTGWKLLGAVGALMFAGRWLVQAYHARQAGKPVTPLMFWVMSLIGSNLQLIYFIWSPKQDMVGVLGSFVPSFVAAYNLFLEIRNRTRDSSARQAAVAKPIIQIAAPETAAGE